MRVIDCDCGETVSAANDAELIKVVYEHVRERHSDQELSEDEARKVVERRAYDATDA